MIVIKSTLRIQRFHGLYLFKDKHPCWTQQEESCLVCGSRRVVAGPQTSAKGQISTVWNQSMKPIELLNKE